MTSKSFLIEQVLFSPSSKPYRLSFSSWTEKWLRWLLAIPKPFNPALDTTGKNCAKNQEEPGVWFLAGTLGGVAKRECVIPEAKAILLPIIIDEQSFAEKPDFKSESDLESLVRSEVDKVIEMNAAIDGMQLSDLKNYRIPAGPFDVTFPEDNICGVKAGPTRAAADGYWLFLKPLSAGRHTIHVFGRGPHFVTEVTYDLTVGNVLA